MPINVACDHCGQSLQVLEEHAGKQVRCPKCYQVFVAKVGVAGGAAPVPAAGEQVPVSVPSPVDVSVPSPAGGVATASPKFCPHCGTGLPGNAGFCPACGRAPTGPQGGGGFVAPSFAPSSFAPQQQGYPSPYGGPAQTCGMATAALVLGIVSFVCLGPLTAIPAVICGHIARGQIRNSNGTLSGDGMALTGLILGYVNLLISCGWIGLVMSTGGSPSHTPFIR
ncbi:MAG: DUF4190 domain-containing protein [Planctomycetes bacterium]|nr:DUF4190 domain-containing protein [Planctomycetota bacterium]